MKVTPFKFLVERSSGLFFGPVTTIDGEHQPIHARDKGWLYNDEQRLAVIRDYFGGDAGANYVDISPPTTREYNGWMGRKGGAAMSARKTQANRIKAQLPRPNAKGKKKPRRVIAGVEVKR